MYCLTHGGNPIPAFILLAHIPGEHAHVFSCVAVLALKAVIWWCPVC